MKKEVPQFEAREANKIRKANDLADELRGIKPPEMLFDEFWREDELALVFGPSGAGKSILAVQIAEAIARGRPIDGFRMPERGQPVLYVNLDISGKQFIRRNSAVGAKSGCFKPHTFSANFSYASPPDVDKLVEWLRPVIENEGYRVVVIDSLAAVKKTQDGVREALNLTRDLQRLKDDKDISILVVTDCLGSRREKALTEADLGRSRLICSVADTVFAVCRHKTHFDHRYIVQTRSKNAAIVWTEKNAPLCRIVKTETGLLEMKFDELFAQKLSTEELELICNMKLARDHGETFREAAELFGISVSRAERLFKKWSPAVEAKFKSLLDATPVEDEMQDGELCHFEGSEDDDTIEREPESDPDDLKQEEEEESTAIEEPSDPGYPSGMDVHAIPFAAALRRRSVYELKSRLDAYGREIFIEKELQHNGKPQIWYAFDSKGYLVKHVRTLLGISGTRLGPGPYI